MSAIRKNYTLADVICQHKTDGTIIPLKIRIAGEDGEYQIFNIKSYKVLSDHKEHTLPNGVSATLMIKRIHLFYNSYENLWKVSVP